jgi:hypothetical protein
MLRGWTEFIPPQAGGAEWSYGWAEPCENGVIRGVQRFVALFGFVCSKHAGRVGRLHEGDPSQLGVCS